MLSFEKLTKYLKKIFETPMNDYFGIAERSKINTSYFQIRS